MKAMRHLHRSFGLCADCGKEDAYTMAGRYRCFECNEKHRKHPTEFIRPERPQKKPSFREDPDRCYLCGAPVMQAMTAWGGHPLRLCEKHYKTTIEAAAKGRKAYQKKYGETWGQTQFRRSQKKNG